MKAWSCRTATVAVAALLLLSVAPLAAQSSFPASNDGWKTPGGGQTVVDLANYPVTQVLGSAPVSNTVSVKGKPLSSSLGTIDTLLERGAVTLSGGTGTGTLQIVALSLTSESNVLLQDGRSFRLDVVRSPTPSPAGTITLTRANSDGGTFSSGFDVLPKLIFTNTVTGAVVNIDCAGGGCTPLHLTASNSGWVNPGGANNFDPTAKGVTPINAGITVQGYTTIGRPASGAVYPGFTAAPGFPAAAISEEQRLAKHGIIPVQDCLGATQTALTAKAVAIGVCKVVANPLPN